MKEEITIPKSLEPENIMSTIERWGERKEKEKKRKKRRRILAVIGAAAVFVCIFAGVSSLLMQEQDIDIGEDIYAEIDGEQVKLENIKVLGSYDQFYQEKKEAERKKERIEALKALKPSFFQKKESSKGMSGINEQYFDFYGNMGASNETYHIVNEAEQDGTGKGENYSETNVQTNGIDEADIVKTDGEYIYFINKATDDEDKDFRSNLYIKIYQADGGNSKLVTNLRLVDAVNARENTDYRRVWLETDGAYLYKDTLILMTLIDTEDYKTISAILFLDVSDKEHPVVSDIIRHEEYIQDSRLYGDILYVCGSMSVDTVNVRNIRAQVGGKTIPENRVYMSAEKGEAYDFYTVVGAFDLSDNNSLIDSSAWLGDSEAKIYMSEKNFYFYNSAPWSKSTDIVKIEMNQGRLRLCAAANVKGYIYNQLALDEYKGYLRVVTTSEANNLYILDKNLTITGKIQDIAPGETIRSARYMGDIGYFVTFRQTDPLFSVDLSEPDNPRIIGVLKIPGFSRYLHFIDENTMIGIGDYDEEGDGITQGVKVSTFDISDPSDVKEVGKWVYKNGELRYGFDHRAVLAVPEKNLYGFGLELDGRFFYADTYTSAAKDVYKVMSYIDGKMREVESIELPDRKGFLESESYEMRGVYIGEYLYIVYNDGMEVYPLSGILQEGKTACVKKLN